MIEVNDILKQMGFDTPSDKIEVSPFTNDEDGEDYAVWKVTFDGNDYVLKEAKTHELQIYTAYLTVTEPATPRVHGTVHFRNKDYLLMEYIRGESLRKCDRSKLVLALDALIAIQELYWGKPEPESVGYGYEESFQARIDRGKYLNDPELERAYSVYLKMYAELPRTLCHDDLLPFNIILNDERAVIIDWEIAGILPYPTALARLIAHCSDDDTAFIYMTDEDKTFAVEYYYEHFVGSKGVDYSQYRDALDCFLLYEYCEWVMLGNKYGDIQSDRYISYLKYAKQQAEKINQKEY